MVCIISVILTFNAVKLNFNKGIAVHSQDNSEYMMVIREQSNLVKHVLETQ